MLFAELGYVSKYFIYTFSIIIILSVYIYAWSGRLIFHTRCRWEVKSCYGEKSLTRRANIQVTKSSTDDYLLAWFDIMIPTDQNQLDMNRSIFHSKMIA